MTKDEALKLALEALEEAWYHVGTFQPTEKAIDLYDEARAAIKEALALPQRTWVGLTDEEIQECYNEAYKIVQGRRLENAFYKTIEAKLKERNT